MSEIKVHKLQKVTPILIKKNALKLNTTGDYDFLLRCVKNAPQLLLKEDEIYRSSDDDFLKGKYPNLVLVNKLNMIQNTSRTTATYTQDSATVKLTSDSIVRVIGQKNYDTVFGALCSIISLETRVQGILSLLSPIKVNGLVSTSSQTIESSRGILIQSKKQRIKRKAASPYVITDHLEEDCPKEVNEKIALIKKSDIKVECQNNDKKQSESESPEKSSGFPELIHIVNEDSNISDTSVGNISLNSCHIPSIVENTKNLLNYIEDHTVQQLDQTLIRLMDGTELLVKGKPDNLHLVTPEILKELSPIQQGKLLWHQAFIDWEMCLQRDEDDNLPLHWAVLHEDLGLLKRQCAVLKSRQQSIDIPAGNMTALQMSLMGSSHKCTEVLLRYGADVLETDEDTRTALHLAAERDEEHTAVVLEHCRKNARSILKDHDEIWEDGFDEKTDELLGDYLINKISVMCDNQGYTPLMLASKMGKYACVSLLVCAGPYAVNMAMPTCGNRALFLAVTEACVEANNSENKSEINEKYMKTIECLVENGADPTIENSCGSSVNDLLNDFTYPELSMMIANKLTSIKYMEGRKLDDFSSYMLIKNSCGGIDLTHVREPSKIYQKPEETHTKKSIEDGQRVPTKHVEFNMDTKNVQIDFKKIVRPKPQKSNSKIEQTKDVLEPRKKQHTTIYKTVPVVKVVSYKTNKELFVIQDKVIKSDKCVVKKYQNKNNLILMKDKINTANAISQPETPLKLKLPELSPVRVKPVAVKRNIEQPNSSSTKRSKNIVEDT